MPQVQVIDRGPSAAYLAGQGLGQGISNVSTAMVNQKLNEMLETKQLAKQYAERYRQGEQIAKFEPNKEKRTMIRDTIAAIGPDMYFKLQDHLGTANMENLISGGFGAGQPTPEPTGMPQGRQMGTQAYDYAPEGPMTATGQGMGQNQPTAAPALRTPTIQQQEMLNAQQAQAANTELMANNVAPNIMGIPKSQKAQAAGPQPQAAGPQPQAGSQEEEQAKNWLRDSSEQEFNQALQSVPQKQRQGYRNYRLALQKEKREAGAQAETIGLKKRTLEGVEKERIISRADAKTKDLRELVSAISPTLINRKSDLEQQRDAIQRGNFGPLSLPHLATIFGLPESAGTDAKQLSAAVKNSVYDKLKTITGVKNVFLEQITMQAFPQIGSTKEGNLIAVDEAMMSIELDEVLVDSFNRINEKYENDPKYGYLPDKAIKEVYDGAKKEAVQIADKYKIKIQEDRESQVSDNSLMNLDRQPIKTPLTQRRSNAIVMKAETDLKRSIKNPTKEQVLQYAGQLLRDNNYEEG